MSTPPIGCSRYRFWVKECWTRALSLGTTFSALSALIGFPSVLVAVVVFHAELFDLVTRPNVRAELREITLRCAYKLQHHESDFGKICRQAPLGVSFSYKIKNDDMIERSLSGLRVVINVPTFGVRDFSFAYDVEHMVRNGRDNVTRRPWFVKRLPSKLTTTYEALLMRDPATSNDKKDIDFGDLIENLNSKKNAVVNKSFKFELYGQVEASEIKLAECDWKLEEDNLIKFLDKSSDNQFQITNYCDTSK